MRATFLIEIDTQDTDLLGYADDIKQDLEQQGHAVISCKPWARQTLQQSSVQSDLPVPQITPNPQGSQL